LADATRWGNKNYYYLQRYGVTLEEIKRHYAAQNGKCAICEQIILLSSGKEDGSSGIAHVDHDHRTNEVRGLLCAQCNQAIGLLRDNPEFAFSAAHYLLKFTLDKGK
jgi:hypothetical protein